MKFDNLGNLGKTDLLNRLISKKFFNDDNSISNEELEEISYQLQQFNYLLGNVYLYENTLKNDGYGALVSILDELRPLYCNYNKETDKELKHIF